MGHYTRLCKSNPRDPKAEPKEGKVKSESAAGVDEHLLEINLGVGGHAPTEYPAFGQESVNHLVRNNQEKLRSAKRRILRHMRFDVKAGKYVSTWTDKRMKVLQVGVSVDREQYQELSGIKSPEEDNQPKVAKQSGVADTGASVCCSTQWGSPSKTCSRLMSVSMQLTGRSCQFWECCQSLCHPSG